MGVQHLRADQPVAYFLFHDRDAEYRNVRNMLDEAAGQPGPGYSLDHLTSEQLAAHMAMHERPTPKVATAFRALAFNLPTRQAYDDMLPEVSRAFHADSEAASNGDLVLTVSYMPGYPPKQGQDYRSNLSHMVTFEPTRAPEATGGRRPGVGSSIPRAGGGG
jgi:hypothetical protein